MLEIKVKEQEFYDSKKEMFFQTKPLTVRMEHSLISIAKWESFWEKPYLPTPGIMKGIYGIKEEMHYIKCMIIGNVPDYISEILLQNHSQEIKKYIGKKHTATTIHRVGGKPPSRQVITTELIYYWMIKFGIPLECQRWHFNRLLMLIDVCNVKESTGKDNKLSSVDAAKHRYAINKARRGK